MRRIMLLCETAHPIIDKHLAAAVIDAALRHGFDLSDEDDDSLVQSTLRMMHLTWDDMIQPAIHGDQLRVYRAIAVASAHSLRADALGKHWSTDMASAHPYNGRNASRWIVLQALVGLTHVDWASTFALHLEGGEYEVELFQGTPVTVTGVEWHTNRGPIDDASADGLVGQTLTA